MESSINAPAKNGANHGANPAVQAPVVEDIPPAAAAQFSHYRVVRRSGAAVPFDLQKITAAMMKAFLAVEGASAAGSARVREIVDNAAAAVVAGLTRRDPLAGVFHIEDVQDQVELALMRGGCHEVARSYILYREARAETRRQSARELLSGELNIVAADGRSRPLEVLDLRRRIKAACDGIEAVDAEAVLRASVQELFDGASEDDMRQAPILAARALIEREPNYSFVAARLLLAKLQSEALGADVSPPQMAQLYPRHLSQMLRAGIDAELLHPDMGKKFDRKKLGAAIDSKRDLAFGYLGLQTLYDRYFLRAPADGRRLELPQSFFMRVAMGLALNEDDPTARAIEFYRLLSSFDFMSSTPTLFNSGGLHSQLSSCYLTTVGDDLADIFEAYRENALLAKFAGGLGNDWTPVRAMGARIKGTNGRSQGVIPFLKIVNDTAVAVNQGGKRKGACCVYLETWHLDIEEFLELRKNTGDERRRAHDTNTANWIPDLFMKRVAAAAEWTLFSPDEVPDLHDKSGRAFEAAYERCEARARAGEIRSKTVRAVDLWRRMLTMLFETGHPWLAFKDPCNIRSPQNHAGIVHSSNLCTEITLNTGPDEIAVCNLGSVNLHAHIKDGALDEDKLRRTVKTAMRMLDNVIDLNYYAVDKARQANMRHRPVGLGMMGFQDCLYELGVSYDSEAAADFADRSTEALCYFAYWASTELAAERGAYSSFAGSLWSRGILPRDSLRLLARERGGAGAETVDGGSGDLLPVAAGEVLRTEHLEIDISATKDWDALRARIVRCGMRNSNCVAIAPTATIANIVGVSASIEPTYQNIFVKSNLSGDFTVANRHLVGALKEAGIWDEVMLADIKYFDGRLSPIDRVPAEIKRRYPTVFEIDPKRLIDCAARRQKWIDQAQSLNLYVAEPSGRKLDEMYRHAWRRGLKTTYYLRSLGASSTEKYTTRAGGLNAVAAAACAIDDPDCEACQ